MNNNAELQTIRDFLRYATSQFNEAGLYYGHGTDNAWDEAIALILSSLHLPHDIHAAVLDARLTQKERAILFELLDKRITKRIPVPYLTHEGWFAGMSFYVDERVLIPRSPIAELIQQHFRPWVSVEKVHAILDVCTGSGCIAIACAKAFPDAHVDATDISTDALTVATMNVAKYALEDQVHLHQGDLFTNLPAKKYNIIISNPPYVSTAEMSTLPPEYSHEPKKGLTAGEEGLDCVTRLLKEASPYLQSDGILVIEVGNSEGALIEKYPHVPFTWLEFENSDGGVFLLTAQELERSQSTV
jgi:ribosomal protein L3 glutamine methyltransferase